MSYLLKKYIETFVILCGLLTFPLFVQAEEGTVKVLAPWKAKGQVYKVGPKQTQFVGEFGGIMYVETGEGTLDTAIFVCPAVQDVDHAKKKTQASGRCHIVAPQGNIYAQFKCSGVPGACNGKFKLTGGTDRFKGISGAGEMRVRSALSSFMSDVTSGQVVQSAEGLATWPALKYKIPDAN
jgi:hypothetical protein